MRNFKNLFFLFFITNLFAQNSLKIKNLDAGPGDNSKIVISLDNVNPVAGFQFKLKLPIQILVKDRETKFIARNTNHVIYPKNLGNGEYLFLAFSATNDNFTGNSGDLFEIPIEIPLTYLAGQSYPLTLNEVVLSNNAGVDIGSNHLDGTLNIIEGKNPDLKVDNITFTNTQITPSGKFNLKWSVQNIGKSTAIGGWTEQVYLVSQLNGKKYLIGNATYSQNLVENLSVNRETEFTIPSIIGFDGDVKIEVVLIPSLSVKEPEIFKENNTILSTQQVFLLKKLTFSIDKIRILRNSNDLIRVYLTRSGDISVAEEFTLSATENQYFNLPQKIMLEKNQSSNFAYISVKPTTDYEGDKEIKLTITGNSYTDENATFTLVEDKKIILNLDYPTNFSSTIGSKILFTLNANYDNKVDKTIKLSSDNSKRIQLPPDIILRAGQKTVTFEGTILDPGIVDKKVKVILYATALDYVPASKEINLNSVNIPVFQLTLAPNTVSEGDGIKATYATLKRTTQLDKEVIVEISASPNDRLILPNNFIFKSGETDKVFNIGTINNSTVEGDQTVTVFSKVKFLDCNCIDDTDNSTLTKSDIKIIDNDGLAFVLSASPSTIKAGAINNTLKIARNTTDPNILKDPVVVTLSSNLPFVIELPATVTIPANQKEITITFNTKIDAALTGDQNARIEAKATNYNVGYTWILVTDQNRPDVVVTKVNLPNQVEAGKKVIITSTILNQGYANFKSGSKIDYYLSPNNSTAGLTPFNSSILNQEIKVGETYSYTEEVQLPVLSGKLNLIVIVNSDFAINELDINNNQNLQLVDFLPAYSVTVTLDKKIYKASEKVVISGIAKTLSGDLVPISDVEITLKTRDFTRKFITKTGNNGSFIYEFIPLPNESGSYSVKAAYPGADVTPQESFDILGFEIVNKPKYIKWEPFVNFPLGKDLVLKNNSTVKLTGVKINLPDNADFELQQTPIDIEAGEQKAIGFTILSKKPTLENRYTEITISVTSNEGAELKEIVYYYSKTKDANLVAEPISINTTMAKGMARLYELTIKNIGDVDATNVEVLLPSVDWMTLKSPKIIEKIEAGKDAKVLLNLEPTLKEQINVPISGNLVLKGSNSNGLSVPFRIETVSDSKGKLIIDATDEYTYNTISEPHLAGAKVQVKLPYSGVIIAEGITDVNGIFEVPSINEGYYTITVEADKHNPYQNNILVDPGKTTTVNAFLQYKAVTYTWQVVPTEITDQYDITLVTQFETNVPKPVVVMKLDNPKLDLKVGESRLVNLTITNHGLIAATDIRLTPSVPKGYEIKPLIESMDVLNAKTTVVVPIMIKRLNTNKLNNTASNDQKSSQSLPDCIDALIDLLAHYFCVQLQNLEASAPFDFPSNCIPSGPGGGNTTSGPGCVNCGGTSNPPPTGVSSNPVKILDICDPCDRKIAKTIIRCLDGLPRDRKFKKGKYKDCIKSIIETIYVCDNGGNGKNKAPKGKFDFLREDFENLEKGDDADNSKISEYLKNPTLEMNDAELELFLQQVLTNLEQEKPFTVADVISIKDKLKSTTIPANYIDTFVARWNNTLIAWNNNIFSPNSSYPDIADKIKVDQYNTIIKEVDNYTFKRGFISIDDMYLSDFKELEKFVEEKSKEGGSVCATITIEFPQRLTMTRQAFEGTLGINNSSSKDIKDINLDLVVKDEFGVDKTFLFQINKEAFLNGTGLVSPNSKGKGVAIFIPTKEAAPTVKKSYSFGGILSYFDVDRNERVNITLNPVTLEVNPSPDLILDYFLQRDIISDDALTEDIVESTIPAELSLMISNDGYGLARNVNVESMQPRIVENKKGLLIDFKMIGSNFNNEPRQLGLLNVNFGDIEPKKSAIGQWYFTSSLLGHFVKYDIKVNHTSSFGNANLSLIKSYAVHELVKSVKDYGSGKDDISDFLVNDNSDANDTPDRIYFSNSNGASEAVLSAESVESSNIIAASSLITKITIKPVTTGWHYGNIADPGGKQYKLNKVIRDKDNVEIPLANFWQTGVTLRDGLNPKYENKLHVLDNISEINTYTLYYNPIDGNIPTVEAFVDAPSTNNAQPVETIKVRFNKDIDVNTFTTNNISLIYQGTIVPTDKILIGKIDDRTYSLSIKELTKSSGYYELSVDAVGIKDLLGNEGKNGKKINWIQFINELGVLKFESDQVKKQPINTITVTFNKQIRSEEFTSNRIKVGGNVINDLTIKKVDDFVYTISGFNTYNNVNGIYKVELDVTKITAVDGTKGIAVQTYEWTVDKDLPKIVSLTPVNQGGVNNQNITEIDLVLSEKIINELDKSAFKFTKNGQNLTIPIIIQKINDLNYKLLGLGEYTKSNGDYRLVFDQSTLIDESNNSGQGIAETIWSVRTFNFSGISGLKLTPDKGASNTDNITSGNDVELAYTTLQDDLNVEVYELQATSELLLYKNNRAIKGEYKVSVASRVGAKKFKVVAFDKDGNASNVEVLNTYIDFKDLVTDIKSIKEATNTNICSGFDFIEVTFDEEIQDNTFDKNTFEIKLSGSTIPNTTTSLVKLSNSSYRINGVVYPNAGNLELVIDKSKILKKSSGLKGLGNYSEIIGNPNLYNVVLTGNLEPIISNTFTYSATSGMSKYEWIIVNGEILTSTNNTVTVKWNKLGEQYLIVRYLTPSGCSTTSEIKVIVNESTLSTDEFTNKQNQIYPVPNKGLFTIETNKTMYNSSIYIFNISGQMVYQENNVTIDKKAINVDSIPPGVYMLIIENKGEKLNFKFTKE